MDFDNSRPIYIQLVERLEQAIASGEYTPGQKLPSVREFAALFQVNPNTIQKALGQLEAQGLIYTKRASGKYVEEKPDEIRQLKMKQAEDAAMAAVEAILALGFTQEETAQILQKALAAALSVKRRNQ